MNSSEERFTLAAKDLLDRLVGIFIAAATGDFESRSYAKEVFLFMPWDIEEIKKWSDEKRAIAHFIANKLAQYDMASKAEIMGAFSGAPYQSKEAQAWSEAINRDCGYPHNMKIEVPETCDGYGYLKWVLGQDASLPTNDWTNVPLGI